MSEYVAEPAGGPSVTYVLIHLDDGEIGDGSLVTDPDAWSEAEYAELRGVVAAAVHRVAARCARRLVLVDRIILDDLTENDSVPALGARDWSGWQIVGAERHEMAQAARTIPAGTPVIVAGFHRADCVARFAAACARRGCAVTIHDVATAPLTGRALAAAYGMRTGAQTSMFEKDHSS